MIDVDAERGLATVGAGIDWVRLINHLLWTFPDPDGRLGHHPEADRRGPPHDWRRALRQHPRPRPSAAAVRRGCRVVHDRRRAGRAAATAAAPSIPACSRSPWAATACSAPSRPSPCDWRGGTRSNAGCRSWISTTCRRSSSGGCGKATSSAIASSPRIPRRASSCRAGVFSCYRPVAIDVPIPDGQRSLAPHEWRRLLRLAHTSKSQAFAEYARYYMATDGQLYWSDTHQLSDYPRRLSRGSRSRARSGGQGQRDDHRALRAAARAAGVHAIGPRRRAPARRPTSSTAPSASSKRTIRRSWPGRASAGLASSSTCTSTIRPKASQQPPAISAA